MNTHIYGLICPIVDQIVYIGKANNPERRLKDHMLDIRDMPPEKAEWVGKLRKAGLKPQLEVLDTVAVDTWPFWETFYIDYYKSLGFKLMNKRSGNGLTFANSQTFKRGNIPWNYGKKSKK